MLETVILAVGQEARCKPTAIGDSAEEKLMLQNYNYHYLMTSWMEGIWVSELSEFQICITERVMASIMEIGKAKEAH